MDDTLKSVKLWLMFAGGVLVVAVLYWARAILVPFALAILLTFVLTPPVNWLQRWVGRVPAVLFVVTLVFAALGLAGAGLTWQMNHLVEDLPGYRANIRTKIADVRLAGRGSGVEKLQETLEGIKTDLETPEAPKGTVSRPLVVTSNQVTGFLGFAWLGPVVGPLTTAGLVGAMVIFMLLERRALRDRLIGLIGYGQLATTTKAFDEAGRRVSRQLLMQSLVSLLWGVAAFLGLYFLHVPYALVWGTLGAAFRFIPYIGPVLAAGAPILVSLAALEGWTGPAIVLAMFVILELFTNLVLETVLYAGAVGVSRLVLLASVAFWTWLWGPLGLLMASPLTVCVVVLGKHVPGLAFVGLLMDDTAALAAEYGFYQRLVARDQSEAAELIDSHIKTGSPASVYDALLLPALSYAEHDRLKHRLSREEEAAVIDATRELVADAAEIRRHAETEPPATAADPSPLGPREPLRVLGYAVNGAADEVALAMLAHLIDDLPIEMEITAARMQAVELASLLRDREFSVVCFADLPPSSSSKTRYLVRRLRATLPELRIAVGRWAPPALADESSQTLLDAGADHVASLLIESRNYFGGLLEMPRPPISDTAEAAGFAARPLSIGRRSS
ncbi:MAG TPA: AI-2E family transporter [Methylomirabilota bacterium]|nr:AI-2E family transporter [Methylomirabilota bacterium]